MPGADDRALAGRGRSTCRAGRRRLPPHGRPRLRGGRALRWRIVREVLRMTSGIARASSSCPKPRPAVRVAAGGSRSLKRLVLTGGGGGFLGAHLAGVERKEARGGGGGPLGLALPR